MLKMKADLLKLRRDRRSPTEDFWHTIRFGAALGLILLIVLPHIIG